MTFYTLGDRSSGICYVCDALVNTTFMYRDVPMEHNNKIVSHVLAAVCDQCHTVIALPPQSTPRILRTREHAEIPLEITLDSRDLEALDFATYTINPDAGTRFRKLLIVFYLRRLDADRARLAQLKEHISSDHRIPAKVQSQRQRLSMKISQDTQTVLSRLCAETQLRKSDLIRQVIQEIRTDFILNPSNADLETLREHAALLIA
jgi:hypothetical protein